MVLRIKIINVKQNVLPIKDERINTDYNGFLSQQRNKPLPFFLQLSVDEIMSLFLSGNLLLDNSKFSFNSI